MGQMQSNGFPLGFDSKDRGPAEVCVVILLQGNSKYPIMALRSQKMTFSAVLCNESLEGQTNRPKMQISSGQRSIVYDVAPLPFNLGRGQ